MIKGHNLKQKYQRGFTIVELLIVIVIIGILAALVLNSFAGVQAKARDTKRQTDIRAVSSQLEAYFNGSGNGSYPLGSTLTTDATALSTFSGLDVNSLHAPNQSTNSYVLPTAAQVTGGVYSGANITTWPTVAGTVVDISHYGYAPMTVTGGAMSICTVSTACNHYILVYNTENNPGGIVIKQSLN